MKAKIDEFAEIERLKDSYRKRISEQEDRIRTGFRELADDLSGVSLVNRVRENLFTGPGFAFKLGFMAVTLLRQRLAERNRRKR